MDTHRADSTHRPVTFRLRNAHHADDDQLQAFDLGDLHEPWLREVADIVSGLLEWRANPDAVYLDRRVVVAVDDVTGSSVSAPTNASQRRLDSSMSSTAT